MRFKCLKDLGERISRKSLRNKITEKSLSAEFPGMRKAFNMNVLCGVREECGFRQEYPPTVLMTPRPLC